MWGPPKVGRLAATCHPFAACHVLPALFDLGNGGCAARQRSRGSSSNVGRAGLSGRDQRPVVLNVTELRSARVDDMFS